MLKIKDRISLCKKLGYTNLTACLEKIEYLEQNGIEEFLKKDFPYDFVLGNEVFLKKVIEICGDEKDLKFFEKLREKMSKKPGSLFVNTKFKKISQPIFSLAAMQGLLNISIDRKNFEDKSQELEYVKFYVNRHYLENNGKLKLWGKIQSYIYKSDSFDKYIVFDVDGNIIDELENFNPKKIFK
ncbi:hypothetical protein [Caminibacter pacificus]|jgi:hypothetical protein